MKKNYQVPETLILDMKLEKCVLLEDSGEIGSGEGGEEGNLTNEANTFDEDSPTGASSSLWD